MGDRLKAHADLVDWLAAMTERLRTEQWGEAVSVGFLQYQQEFLRQVVDVLDRLRAGEMGPVTAKRRLKEINNQVAALLDRAGEG